MAILALAACQEREPTGPNGLPLPQYVFSQANGFRFIAPTPPGNPRQEGEFNPNLAPVVRIVQVSDNTANATPTGNYAACFTVDAGAPCGGPITVDVVNQQYQVSWTGLNQLKAAYPANRYYRITVQSDLSDDAETWGTVDVQLTDGAGSGLNISGNTLPIKFWISYDLTCSDEDCLAFTVVQGVGGQFVLQRTEPDVGSVGLDFAPDFCASEECNEDGDRLTVIVERFRGEVYGERCIPAAAGENNLQYEVCVRIRSFPEDVDFVVGNVIFGVCLDERLSPVVTADRSLVRARQVKESEIGRADPTTVEEVDTGPLTLFMDCRDDVFALNGRRAAPNGVLARLAAGAGSVLLRAAHYLSPTPAYARRRAHVPFTMVPVGCCSRFGIVLPVKMQVENDFGFGFPGQVLSPKPTVRVVAVKRDGTASNVGVPHVQVRFTPAGMVAHGIVETDATGRAAADWTLGGIGSNPQTLVAEAGAPERAASIQEIVGAGIANAFPNNDHTAATTCTPGSAGCFWWDAHEFTATAREYAVYFLAPLGQNPGGLTNVKTPSGALTLRVCLINDLDRALDVSYCPDPPNEEIIAPPVLKNNVWETSWKTNRNTVDNALYRIDVLVGENVVGTFPVRRGGGGGSDPAGTYQFQTGSQLPIKFILVAQ